MLRRAVKIYRFDITAVYRYVTTSTIRCLLLAALSRQSHTIVCHVCAPRCLYAATAASHAPPVYCYKYFEKEERLLSWRGWRAVAADVSRLLRLTCRATPLPPRYHRLRRCFSQLYVAACLLFTRRFDNIYWRMPAALPCCQTLFCRYAMTPSLYVPLRSFSTDCSPYTSAFRYTPSPRLPMPCY